MILSLQGCMAVGKTTAVRYLQENAPYVHISYEINTDVVNEIKQRQLDKNKYEDYLEIQKLWLNKEVIRYQKAKEFPCSIMDFGAEEVEFYTLNYPKTIGKDWEIENALRNELEAVRRCMPTRILFLDASNEVVIRHKENDNTRSRNFFEHHLKYLLPLKRKWFLEKENVDVLNVDNLNAEEVGEKVKEWVDFCIKNFSKKY
ncbi:MAG: AAA family ATPase [Lachnospiraceae bacterium]|nr:AAA family ATPase [Lachnospiraceae bacterium]